MASAKRSLPRYSVGEWGRRPSRRVYARRSGTRQAPQKGDPVVPDIAEASGGVVGVSGVGWRDRCRDGVDGRVLASGLRGARHQLPSAVGQRPVCEARSRAQDGCLGLRVALAASGVRASQEPIRTPPPEVREVRDLTRLRKTLIQDRSSHVNRVAKVLEMANVKLGSVVSNIMGVTGRGSWKP